MATAKVTINDRVIMDITDTTATAATIREGYTAYGADGEKVTGTYTGATINNQNKSVTPTESQQSVTADSGYTGLGTVTVGAISSTYVGSGIEQRDETDLTASGATVTVPSGYYAEQETKTIDSGVVNLPYNISGTSASVTTGTNTITLNKTIGITPSVTHAGYVDSIGTSQSNVSLTASVTTKARATITPTTTDQTISSGTYLTGTQTISGDSDLVAGNIKDGITIFGIEGTYAGTTINNQNKTVTPTTSEQSVTYDSGYTGLGTVTVNAIPNASASPTILRPAGNIDEDSNFYYIPAVNWDITDNPSPFYSSDGYATVRTLKELYGDATTSDVLSNKTFSSENGFQLTGTMPNNGATGGTISTQGGTYTIPAGYTSGGTVTANITAGSATAPATILGGSGATVGRNSSGVISLIKTVSVTPTVTAGYISTGTAGDSQIILSTQGTVVQETTYTPTTSDQTIFNSGIHYFEGVQKVAGDADLVAGNIKQGVTIFGVEGTYSGAGVSLQTKSVNPTESQQEVTPDSGYDGLSKVTVGAISSTYVGSGIDRRDETDLTASGATVTVPAGYYADSESYTLPSGEFTGFPTVEANSELTSIKVVQRIITAGYMPVSSSGTYSKKITDILPYQGATAITPTESQQTAANEKTWLTGAITVSAIPSDYVGSEIDQRDGDDLTASGATVSVPAGYYAEAASKSVATGSAGTPTAAKGTVSNHSVSVTPSVTNTTGYITGGTKTGTAVTVSASELVSGTLTISSSGTKDVTNYASASVAAGSATAPASISGTTATVSTGTNTLTLTKTVSVTPSVTAGYVSSGTAGNSSVSLTANVTTKGAATITPTTSNQTIASGTYLTGTQTIAGDANLVGSNIISGKSIFGVSGTVVINKYYTGSSAPSSSLGNDGDIYLQN